MKNAMLGVARYRTPMLAIMVTFGTLMPMRAQYANASESCNKYQKVNYKVLNDCHLALDNAASRALALLAVSRKAK